MANACFQCPASGLGLVLTEAGELEECVDEWAEFEADAGAIASTREWAREFRRALRVQVREFGGFCMAAADQAARDCGLEPSELNPLSWDGAVEKVPGVPFSEDE